MFCLIKKFTEEEKYFISIGLFALEHDKYKHNYGEQYIHVPSKSSIHTSRI